MYKKIFESIKEVLKNNNPDKIIIDGAFILGMSKVYSDESSDDEDYCYSCDCTNFRPIKITMLKPKLDNKCIEADGYLEYFEPHRGRQIVVNYWFYMTVEQFCTTLYQSDTDQNTTYFDLTANKSIFKNSKYYAFELNNISYDPQIAIEESEQSIEQLINNYIDTLNMPIICELIPTIQTKYERALLLMSNLSKLKDVSYSNVKMINEMEKLEMVPNIRNVNRDSEKKLSILKKKLDGMQIEQRQRNIINDLYYRFLAHDGASSQNPQLLMIDTENKILKLLNLRHDYQTELDEIFNDKLHKTIDDLKYYLLRLYFKKLKIIE